MPPVQNLVPGASGSTPNVTHYLSEELKCEPIILIYHERLLAHEWHYTHGVSDRVWCILQEYEPHSNAIHEFPEVHRRPESLINRIVFELAYEYEYVSQYGPSLSMVPGDRRGANSAFLNWAVWGYFQEKLGDWGPVTRVLPFNTVEELHFLMTGTLPKTALIYFASVIWTEPQFIGWPWSTGRFVGELISRAMLWREERDFLFYQTLPLNYYKMLKRLPPDEREAAYLWIIYHAVHPQAGLSMLPSGKEHYFPKFMYDKLESKPVGKAVVVYAPRQSPDFPAGLRVFPWPPITGTPWRYHSSSIRLVYPNCFDEDFDENSEIDDDNIGSPPPNSQPYRNLNLTPIVLQRIFLPPQDPSLGILALRHTATPWETSLTPRTRMWVDEFRYDLGKYGFYYVLPYYYDAGCGKGRMWQRSKGKIKGKAYRQEPGQPEPQGMQAPRLGIPLYAPNKRGQVRAVYRSSDGRLVAFSSSGSEEEPAAVAEEEPDSDECDPLPPLPHEQAGLPLQERCT